MKKIGATIVSIVGVLFALLGIILFKGAVRDIPGNDEEDKLSFFLAGLIFFSLGIFLWRLSKKMKSVSASKILQRDKRPPVLYLRSFKDEKKSFKAQDSTVVQYLTVMGAMLPQNLNSEEEQLAILLNNIGPTICLGKPGDFLPPSGMYREYVASEHWQDKVKEYVAMAQLVLIRANETEGLKWEIDYLWNHAKKTKLIFLLPETQKRAASFNTQLTAIIGKSIPTYKVEWFTNNFSGLLHFDGEGNPKVIPMKNQYYRFGNLISLRLKKTLETLPAEVVSFRKLKTANRLERLAAFFFDLLIVCGIALVPGLVTLYIEDFETATGIFILSAGLLYIFYSFFMDLSNEGVTFGRKYFNLKMMDKEQIEPSLQQIITRVALKLTSALFFYIDIVLFLITKNHLHDYLSATRVFKTSPSNTVNP